MTRMDVLGLGCTAVDEVVHVAHYPAADEKMPIDGRERRCGGLTGAALVTAARLGAVCAYAGCLGPDDLSRYVAQNLEREGINLDSAPRPSEGRVVHSVIIVSRATGSRNIFFENSGMVGAHDSRPPEEVIRATKVLFIDHCGWQGSLRAARVARAAGVAVVADLEETSSPLFPEVLELVDHLILSERFACQISETASPEDAALALWRQDRAVVIVTCGARGCWSVSVESPHRARHRPAFPVVASDTTGCGDVFHGAYAARLATGDDLDLRIRYATAAAALKARDRDIPRLETVERFLAHAPELKQP